MFAIEMAYVLILISNHNYANLIIYKWNIAHFAINYFFVNKVRLLEFRLQIQMSE